MKSDAFQAGKRERIWSVCQRRIFCFVINYGILHRTRERGGKDEENSFSFTDRQHTSTHIEKAREKERVEESAKSLFNSTHRRTKNNNHSNNTRQSFAGYFDGHKMSALMISFIASLENLFSSSSSSSFKRGHTDGQSC